MSKPSIKRKALMVLTVLQHGSATFIGVFLAVHLSAPASALLGGSNASSQVMLLGREYYQTTLGEPLLVWAPLAVHTLAALGKSILLGPPKSPSILGVTGWLTIVLLPIHVFAHRLAPSSSLAPVTSLGPSQLDFEYVKVGLKLWPILNWTLYSSLVIGTTFHAAEGAAYIYRVWSARLFPPSSTTEDGVDRRRKLKKERVQLVKNVTLSAGISSVMAGLAVIATESLFVSRAMMTRMEAAWMGVSLFRLTR